MDGWITIGTDVDSEKFDAELKKLQKESEKFAKEEERLLNKKAKLELDTSKTKQELDSLEKKIDNTFSKLEKAKVSPKTSDKEIDILSTKHDNLINKSIVIGEKYEFQKQQMDSLNQKLIENATNQDLIKGKIEQTEAHSLGLGKNFDGIGKSIKDSIKKVGKMALAVFSIRTAYNAVRQAMSTISGYNDDMTNKLHSIKMIFASALEPIVTRLVNLAWKLMGYVAYIAKAWFGIDIMSKASANSLKASSKNAKDLKKTITGIDEANILNDNGQTGTSNSPKFEMPDMSENNIPSWIKWIADNKDTILRFFTELGILWGTMKIAEFILKLKNLKKGLLGVSDEGKKASLSMKSFGKMIGSAMIVGGLTLIATHVFNLIKGWNDMTPAEKSAEVALILLGVAFVALGLTIRGAIDTATFGLAEIIGLIVALTAGIGALVAHFLSQEETIKSVTKAEEDLKVAQDGLRQATDDYASTLDNYDNALKKVEESVKALEEAERKNGITGAELQAQVDNGTLSYDKMTESQKEVYKAYINNEQAQANLIKSTEDLKTGADNLTEAKKKEKIATWDAKLAQEAQNGAFKDGGEKAQAFKNSVIDAYEKGELSAEEARDLIGKSMSQMSRSAQKSFMEDLPNAVKDGLDPKKYETFGQKFSKFFSSLWDGIKNGASSAWNKIKGWFGGSNDNGNGFAKGGMIYGDSVYGFEKGGITYPKLQYCASGAIINQPGRGVPITQAIGGERGAEGILPLTDSQQMDLLGASIARHMTVNLTNINQINGRTLSRELKIINAQEGFAMNS